MSSWAANNGGNGGAWFITAIAKAAGTASQNKDDCLHLAGRVSMIAYLLPYLQEPELMARPEVRRPLASLDDTLQEAYDLVMSCQGKSRAYRIFMARKMATRFMEVQARINSYLAIIPLVSYVGIMHRVRGIYGVLMPPNQAAITPPIANNQLSTLVLQKGMNKFNIAEIAAATKHLVLDGPTIWRSAYMARQNNEECEQLACYVSMIGDLLPNLQDPEMMARPELKWPLDRLNDTLREANELVMSCKGRSAAYRIFMAKRLAKKFRNVQCRIDSYLAVIPFMNYVGITSDLDKICNVLLANHRA